MTEMNIAFGKESKLSKVARYGWIVKDRPGLQTVLSKALLTVDPQYQRHDSLDQSIASAKVQRIASRWSWIALGVITVAEREGSFLVIDGANRVLAARRRSDIDLLPCIVFQTKDAAQEASGFLDANTERKPVSSVDKYKAALVAGDQSAINVRNRLINHNLTLDRNGRAPRSLKSIALLMRLEHDNPGALESALSVISKMVSDCPVREIMIDALVYLDLNVEGGINGKLEKRVIAVGSDRLILGAKRAAAYFSRGGAKVWATGMLDEINKNLQHKFELGATK